MIPSTSRWSAAEGELPQIEDLPELAELTLERSPLFVRVSRGPRVDASSTSLDHQSGCVLPGLSANPLNPEPWWTLPVELWVARQLHQYVHLVTPDTYPWVLTGEVVGRGPDCEPLLASVDAVAAIAPGLLATAERVYRAELER